MICFYHKPAKQLVVQKGAKITEKTTTDPHAKTLRRKEKKYKGSKKGNLEIQKKYRHELKKILTQRHKEKQTTYPHAPAIKHVGQEVKSELK